TLAVVGLNKGKATDAVVKALDDKSVARRAAAARTVGRSTDTTQRAKVKDRLKDADPRVRFRAAQGLLAGKDNESIPALVALLTEGPAPMGGDVEDLLFGLAGEKSPDSYVGGASDAERKKARAAWEAWYKADGSKIDLAKFDPDQRTLGLTLCVGWDADKGPTGRMFEIDLAGKE